MTPSTRFAALAALLLSPSLATAADSVARVADREGQAARRPVGSPRWAPAEAGQPLEEKELVKTGARGANALKLALAGGGQLLLGPGAQVELLGPARVSIHAGEVLVVPGQPLNGPVAAVEVQGQRGQPTKVAARKAFRTEGQGLKELAAEPAWIAGYEQEETKAGALGALLAKVDGRDVPLSIGYHSVQIDVKDGIARTVIEESFKNHTSSVLEGVFYFPLPAEASISGFSMWIGDQQVHGEIVEKEKARAIYETILREKRDPGLLEWEGGSLFKARVYPIGSEKRIQISYTEVLPRVLGPDGSSTWVYRYALESDALRQHPLEKLQVRATVSSTRPLAEVACPSHACRVEKTANAARLEHSAEEVRAAKDFELRITTEAPKGGREAGGLTVTAHRRGDDGYFLLLVDTPPAPADEVRAALRQPLDLMVVCDTSGSLEGTARENQLRFVAALLESLGEGDTFNLISCDAQALPAFERSRPATAANVEAALGKLAGREPLGWSDLDQAFDLAAKLAGATTKVVYLGDGAVTTGDADPAAFAARLQRAWPSAGPPVHAVVPGAFAEPLALRGMAALGQGGTVRALAGQDTAVAVFELLRDLSAPLIRGLEVRVEGLETAAVHPADLPALVAGSQQVVVGRFDPRAPKKRGAVLVAGRRGSVPFRLVGELLVPETEDPDGASFIPRLWARRQLDHLLSQGSGAEVRERVITLSEDYQLITPWTSFLVLETDADRERFQVKKRMRMRDGEELFSKARQGAEQELAKAQLQRARRWRKDQRARVLAAIQDMGRSLAAQLGGGWGHTGGGVAFGVGGESPRGSMSVLREDLGYDRSLEMADAAPATPAPEAPAGSDEPSPEKTPADDGEAEAGEELEKDAEDAREEVEGKADKKILAQEAFANAGRRVRGPRQAGLYGYVDLDGRSPALPAPDLLPSSWERQGTWLDGLLPWLGEPYRPSTPTGWSPEALALVSGLDRRPRIKALAPGAGLRITVRREHRAGEELVAGPSSAWLLGPDRWAVREGGSAGEDARLEWVLDGKRAALTLAWLLGRQRPAVADDASGWLGPFVWAFGQEPGAYAGWTVETAAGELRLTHAESQQKLVVTIDAARGLVTSVRHEGPAGISLVEMSEAIEVAGAHWPGLIVTKDTRGQVTARERITVEALEPAAMNAAMTALLAPRERALLVGPLPTPRAARVALAAGKAGLEERWALLGALGQDGRWSEAWPHLDALATLAGDRPALVSIRATCWSMGRRQEELSGLLLAAATAVAATAREADAAAAETLADWGNALGEAEEQLRLLERLNPVVARRAAEQPALAAGWEERLAAAEERAGRPDQALARRRALVERFPGRAELVQRLASTLVGLGDLEGALGVLAAAAAKATPAERVALEWQAVSWLQGASEVARVVAEVERMLKAHPAALIGAHLHQARLQALVQLDREPEAREWARAALKELEGQAPLEPGLLGRAGAALSFTLESAQEALDPEAAGLLQAAGRALLRRGPDADPLLGQLQGWQFLQTEPARALARELHARLASEQLEVPELVRLAGWARSFESYSESSPERLAAWRQLTARMIERWRAALEKDARAAELLAGFLRQDPAGSEAGTAWRRELLERAKTPIERRALAGELIDRLSGERWGEAAEAEAWKLLGATGPLEGEAEVLRELTLDQQAQRLGRLVDWSSQSRADATLEQLEAARSRAIEGATRVAIRIQLDEAKLLAFDLGVARVLETLRGAGRLGVAGKDERGPVVDLIVDGQGVPEQLAQLTLGQRAGATVRLGDVATVSLSGPDHRLPRRKQAAARAAALRETQAAVRERLRGLALPGLEEWLLVEGAWLDVKAGGAERRGAARATCAALLDRRIASFRTGAAPGKRQQVIAARALCTVLQVLIAETGAPRDAAARDLVAALRRANDAGDLHLDWRKALWTALLALDDADGLLAALEPWTTGDAPDAPEWARRRAWLLADRDRLADAAAALGALDAAGEAGPDDLTGQADLLLALGRSDEASAARGRSYQLRPEHELSQLLWSMAQRVSRSGEGIPEPLDAEAPRMLLTLLRKAEDPRHHAWIFQQLYMPTREPRLLEALADALPGHSPGRMLALVEAYRPLLQQVQEEASVDRAVARASQLAAEPGRSALDKRGLDLFLYLLAQAAAAQTQGGEPHTGRALAALRSAFPGAEPAKWAPGEQRRWAEVLSAWAPAGAPALNEELLRQLSGLAGAAEVGSDERLHLTGFLARALASCGRTADAAHALGGAVSASTQANGGALPPRLWPWALELVGWLQTTSEWRPAEALLEEQLRRATERGLAPIARNPLLRRLHALRAAAVLQGAELRQGRGKALLQAELTVLRAELAAPGRDDLAIAALHDLVNLLDAAHRQGSLGATPAEEAGVLARTDLPRLLAARQHRPAQQVVGTVAELLERLRSPADALELLLTTSETEPAWLLRRRANVWSQEEWRISDLRHKAAQRGPLPAALTERLAKSTLAELARRLSHGQTPPYICRADAGHHFWEEQAGEFLRVAREAIAARPAQEEVVVALAWYLEHGLNKRDVALVALREAHARQVLGPAGQEALIATLERGNLHAEAVPLIEALLLVRTEDLGLRLRLALALHHSGQAARRDAALTAAEGWLGETRRREEEPLRALGETCLVVGLAEKAEALLRESLALRTRARGNAPDQDGWLANLYELLARACAARGRTAEAVEAAAGAVVAWGRDRDQRARVLGVLEQVLHGSPDLPAYVKAVRAEEARTGLINPTLHRALARVFRGKGDLEAAERHLATSLEVAPDDADSLALRVELKDALEQPAEAARAQLALARHLARDPAAWRALGERLARLGQAAEAERVFTHLAEYSPQESEGHQALAEVREGASRFQEAADQWRQVARIRSKEPHGWTGLLRCLVALGAREEALAVGKQLQEGGWDQGVKDHARELLRQLEGR